MYHAPQRKIDPSKQLLTHGAVSRTHERLGYHDGQVFLHEMDELAVETAIALVYNGIAHAVQMCSAQDLEDFALGFSLTEGIVDKVSDIYTIELVPNYHGVELHIELPNRCFERLKRARRALAGRTGCGICGAQSLEHVTRELGIVKDTTQLSYPAVEKALGAFRAHQVLNQQTGSMHGAAYLNAEGDIVAIREDLGRHNALDKLIGHCLKNKLSGGAILVSSRASFEMVQKVIAANVGTLLAISGATSLGVELAEQHNVTLAGYCRAGRMNVYSHAHRIKF